MGVFNFSTKNYSPVIIHNNRENGHNVVYNNAQTVLTSSNQSAVNVVYM